MEHNFLVTYKKVKGEEVEVGLCVISAPTFAITEFRFYDDHNSKIYSIIQISKYN
jgi:hypothetical protein